MRSGPPGAACCGGPWGYLTTLSRTSTGAQLATLRHFDTKVPRRRGIGPLIPCERRLAETEIPENQEADFRARFGNRDYDRPFRVFMVTLRRFD